MFHVEHFPLVTQEREPKRRNLRSDRGIFMAAFQFQDGVVEITLTSSSPSQSITFPVGLRH